MDWTCERRRDQAPSAGNLNGSGQAGQSRLQREIGSACDGSILDYPITHATDNFRLDLGLNTSALKECCALTWTVSYLFGL